MFTNKMLANLIIPLVLEQALSITVGLADVMMVSSCGEAAVSGVSLVDMVNVLIINVFAALATGGAVTASQFLGAKKADLACQSAGQLICITFLISFLIMCVSLAFRAPLLHLLFGSIDADVLDNCLRYFWLSALSYPFLAVYNACAALYRAMGNSCVSMLTAFWMNLINIGGNALFIFGLHWGIDGVAVPSLIARVTACAIMLLLIRNPKQPIHIKLQSIFSVNLGLIKKILRIGIPNGLENSMFQAGRVLVVSIIAGFGTVQTAANAVANNLDSLGTLPGQAMSLAMITVVGQCVGARDFEQVRLYVKKLMKITYCIMFICNATILLTMPFLFSLYNLSAETIRLATILVLIHDGIAMLIWPAAFTLPNALRASNDVRYTMAVSIFSMWMFRIVFSFILGAGLGLGAIGVWIAMILDWIFRASLFVIRFKSGRWQLQSI